MLAKKNKLDTRLFKETLKAGRSYYFDFFSIKVLKNTSSENSRVAFVASKKQFKTAVERNLIRRKGFNIIKNLYKNIAPSYILIFFLKKEATQLSFDDFRKKIFDALKKIGALQTPSK